MTCFTNVLAVLLFISGGFVSGQEELSVGKYDNVEPFSLLCRIYNVARNPPINYVDLQEAQGIGEEIDDLNASIAEEKVINETEQMGNSVLAQLQHTTTRERALAQLSLNQITQKAHIVLEDIKRMKVIETIENAKADFAQVIFGENGNESELEQTVLNGVGDRARACGNTGLSSEGTSAGKNLVVDFFCLCVQRQDGKGVNQVCGFYVGSGYENGQLGWNETGPMGSSTMWASIKGGCGKYMQQHPKSTAEARHILDQFLKHLKTGGVYRWGEGKIIQGSDRKEGMLGTSMGKKNGGSESGEGPVCNGKKGGKEQSPGGVCVYYGSESKSWEDNILWLKKLRTALTTVDTLNNQTATVQRKVKKIHVLLHRAEEIYETTKVISEIHKPGGLTAFHNASGNLTAHNTTRTRSYSYRTNPCFMQVWLLLFL